MQSLNKVMLHGNLTSDPEVKATKTGRSLTTFSLATNRDWKNKEGEVVSETSFHRIVAFGKLGGIVAQYLKKGMPVIAQGRLNNRSYLTEEGSKRYVTEVVLEDFNFISRGKKSRTEEAKSANAKEAADVEAEEEVLAEAVA